MARPSGVERFVHEATQRGLVVNVVRHQQGTRTAADAAAAIGCDVDQIVKSLVFMSDVGPVVALVSGANRVDLAALGAVVGTEVRRATADEVRDMTGFVIGATPPLGHTVEPATVIDEDLIRHQLIWAAAGAPDAVFSLTPAQLVDATGGAVSRVAA